MDAETKFAIKPLLALPSVAWGTLALFFAGIFFWCLTLWLGAQGQISSITFVALSAVAIYIVYTPLHEAVHGAVGKSLALNEWVGRISSSMLFAPFKAFQLMHLKHHSHVNDEELDPDYWSAKPGLLLRWMTQDLFYYSVYLSSVSKGEIKSVPLRLRSVGQMILLVAIALLATHAGYGKVVLLGWILPGRLAAAWLSFIFNYLPHHPHDPTVQTDRFSDTMVRSSPWLDWLFCLQNYHLIHHLYPKVPFYRYKRIWLKGRDYFLSQGAHEEKPLFSL